MTKERPIPLKDQLEFETQRATHIRRLAGIVEVGGQFGFSIYRSTKYNYVYPYIAFNDNLERVSALSQVYGGSYARQSENSWMWRITGQRAADIAHDMRLWTPSRTPIIDAFQDLMSSDMSFEEGVEMSRSFLGANRRRGDVAEEVNRKMAQLLDDVRKIGMSVEDYARSKNTTIDAIRAQYEREMKDMYAIELALEQIADTAKITVEQNEIEKMLEEIVDAKEKEKALQNSYLYASILKRQKTLDHLLAG